MHSRFQLAFKYLSYFFRASSGKGHGIHSPFIFDFIKKVCNDVEAYSDYGKVEDIRRKLLRNKKILTIEDYGAGSSLSKSGQRSVSSVTKYAVKSTKYARLLYRMVKYYQPKTIIELGTSLGLTTSYLALANPAADVRSLEGSADISNIARQTFKDLELQNIKLVEGNFDNTLPAILYQLPSVDFAFIDGNHRLEPTQNYFQWLLSKANNNSIFIFDDIHWSKEMEQAWSTIKAHPSVMCTIDIFFLGIIFFRQEFREKQHFTIRI